MEIRPETTLPDHPVRIALLDLLAEVGTVTANEASRRLGYSSGLCSFHLRQLARQGLIEEAPRGRGRIRPWQLRWESSENSPEPDLADPGFTTVLHLTPDELNELAESMRELIERYPERAPEGAGPRAVTVDFHVFSTPTRH